MYCLPFLLVKNHSSFAHEISFPFSRRNVPCFSTEDIVLNVLLNVVSLFKRFDFSKFEISFSLKKGRREMPSRNWKSEDILPFIMYAVPSALSIRWLSTSSKIALLDFFIHQKL